MRYSSYQQRLTHCGCLLAVPILVEAFGGCGDDSGVAAIDPSYTPPFVMVDAAVDATSSTADACVACGIQCQPGFQVVGTVCVRVIGPPRPLAPLSSATVTSARPSLRWQLAPTTDGAELDVCATRACDTNVQSIAVQGDRYAFTTDLAPGAHFWRVRGRAAGVLGTAMSPTWEFFVGHPQVVSDAGPPTSGSGVDSSGGTVADFNGDGFADLVVADSGPGHIYVYWGGPGGLSDAHRLTLVSPGGANTIFVASGGDLDGDGFADLAVGNPSLGQVYIFRGGLSGFLPTPSAVLSTPYPTPTDGSPGFGSSVTAAGDLQGLGYASLVLGVCNANRVEVYAGGPQGVADSSRFELLPPVGALGFGCAVAGASDVDGDGYDDLVVGAPKSNANVGEAYVYLGAPTGLSQTPSVAIPGPAIASALFGQALAGAGDVNGDGYADVVIGAPGAYAGAGRAYVFYGSTVGLPEIPSLAIPSPGGPGAGFGSAVASAGDTNGDGLADVAIGSPAVGSSDAVGTAYVYLGASGGVSTNGLALVGNGYNFGATLTAGNYSGSGFWDLAVGSMGSNAVYVYPGSLTGVAQFPAPSLVGPSGTAGMSTFGGALAMRLHVPPNVRLPAG
jgi:hypothetical protein